MEVGREELLVALVTHLGAVCPHLVVSVSGLADIPMSRISTFQLSCLSQTWADVPLCSAPEGVPLRLAGVLLPPGDSSFPGSDPLEFASPRSLGSALTPGRLVAARVQGLWSPNLAAALALRNYPLAISWATRTPLWSSLAFSLLPLAPRSGPRLGAVGPLGFIYWWHGIEGA